MPAESNILIYQTEDGNTKIDVRLENETVWMTQKAIAELYQTTPQNITLHIRNILQYADKRKYSCYFSIIKKEGLRNIRRKLIYYNLDIIYNIAIRGQYFEKINKLISFAKIHGLKKEYLEVFPIKEKNFEEMLKDSLIDIVEIHQQFNIDKYYVDFYIPQLKLVIEYDEKHHVKQIEKDKLRQKVIEEKLQVEFIRVKEGQEMKGLNLIIKDLLKKKGK
ncbi:DUF559 domain-containing protein [Alkalibacterium kapii]|uniref:DUF559 domain-containing protein n=1 Tax=Alkalibacterium kapii TaxID=426704 RepID=A0A511AT16_9LACT|nr:DUF559 domain-containing protein [Alkalibacterium kapii]GEK91246.1 hypothetical protein AKA01nite_08680 [Alkalibacterium kapii]